MVKAYLRYEPSQTFGVINSTGSNIIYDHEGKLAIAPALEEVIVWDIKKGTQIGKWKDLSNRSEVTCIARSPNNYDFAVGYEDGNIRIWNIKTSTSTVTLNGHRGAVTALSFDSNGTRLVSGSKDTDIIIWDVVAEVGQYRLKGHKDQITQLAFIERNLTKETEDEMNTDENTIGVSRSGYVLSSSKDTLLKLWDLSTQHCRETVVGHRTEVWSFAINGKKDIIISGSSEQVLKVWKIDWSVLAQSLEQLEAEEQQPQELDAMDGVEHQAPSLKKAINLYGNLPRSSRDRVITVQFHPSQEYIGVQAADKSVELYRVREHEEIRKKMQRRKRRQKEKGKEIEASDEIQVEDEFTPHVIVRTPVKVRSFDFAPVTDVKKAGQIQFVASLINNTIDVYSAPLPVKKASNEEQPEPVRLHSLDLQGHRGDIRALALSTDDELLASASNNILKIWNVKSTTCIRSLECGFALCSAFLPGNRHVIVGTKTGELELYDLASSSMLESIKAHDGAIYSLQVRPDKRGLVTGSADKDVKFWDFDMIDDKSIDGNAQTRPKRLTLSHMRTLKMSDEVLCVKYSPDQNLVAVSLLDTTVKVFYHDTLKFFLSLYGHKLPVLSMDISSDSTLIATCSADKNVKLWGLDFGDCHKSIFAHQESIMAVQFVWGTHYFFTASKDKTVKYWDGDKFENIMKLEGHHGEVWSLVISKHGTFVVSGSHDRSLRIWERTEEQLFLEEEREKELDELYESTLAGQMEKTDLNEVDELGSAGKQTMETLKAGEKIIEALDLGDEDQAALAAYHKAKSQNLPASLPQRNPILIAMGDLPADKYVLQVVEKVRANDLEEALLVLPFSKVMSLINYLDQWAKKDWNIVLVCRILFTLLKTHHHQIVANRMMRPMLDSIRFHLRSQLQKHKDTMGYNRAALVYMQRDYKSKHMTEFQDEDGPSTDDGQEKKRKFVNVTV
ncbi:beta transducin [Umbelopsis sp. WA50703]